MTFKPTHMIPSGVFLQLEHKFFSRLEGSNMGLFHTREGAIWLNRMDCVTELPKVLQVSSYEEPEPLRVAPEVGSTYWIIHVWANSAVASFTWNGDTTDHQALAAGEAYATQEDAIAAYAARRKARGFA